MTWDYNFFVSMIQKIEWDINFGDYFVECCLPNKKVFQHEKLIEFEIISATDIRVSIPILDIVICCAQVRSSLEICNIIVSIIFFFHNKYHTWI